ncbi:MAG: tetratricopeptide repeat protein, partial [Bryobacteraceae bacterium]
LAQGGDRNGAAQNAFDQPVAALQRRASAYLAAGQFPTAEVSARALNPNFDFPERTWDRNTADLTLADLLAANPARAAQAAAAYGALKSIEAEAGLGLLAAREKKTEEARRYLGEATAGGSRSPFAWVELAAIESDSAKARADLEKAVPLNPLWGEPHLRLSKLGADPAAQVPELKIAARLEPRNAELWQTLAETALAANEFEEAEKAWSAAERAAATPGQRAQIHKARLDVEQKRLDFEEAERRRAEEEKARDLERVRNAALAQVQQAVADANRKMAANGSTSSPNEVVPWSHAQQGTKKLDGVLQQVDCLGKSARLAIRGNDGSVTRLMIRNATGIVLPEGGEHMLGCGAQSKDRRVHVEYKGKPDAKLGVAGDVVSVELL